ncbi:MAG: nucleotide exchange factor GrpE [Chitinispirillaceae bacterium]|nr:nucleotide exchange factor GrpE [Chitinispirillaceae bacterium]
MTGEVEDQGEQIDILHDRYLRLMADFENYKRRSGQERQRLIEAADELLIGELIDVREIFERAFKSGDRGDKFVDGMKLNYAKLNTILKNHGLEAYGEPGNKFDPGLHEALICAPNETIPDSHISEVLERGYTVKGKIIKHAKVAVSSGKSQSNPGHRLMPLRKSQGRNELHRLL